MEVSKYRNLRALLNWDRTVAKETILQLQEDSKQVIEDIEEEMIRLHGYKWKVGSTYKLKLRQTLMMTSLDMDWLPCRP
jgi:hypothetical protein